MLGEHRRAAAAITSGLPSTWFGIRSSRVDEAKPSTRYAVTNAGVTFKSPKGAGAVFRSPVEVTVNGKPVGVLGGW